MVSLFGRSSNILFQIVSMANILPTNILFIVMKNTLWIALLVTIMIACAPEAEKAGREMPPALDMANLDQSVDPKENFYQFANGNWLKEAEIPADEGSWGGFSALRDENNEMVLDIMEGAAENPEFIEGSDERKAINLFAVGMDSSRAESVGVGAISRWIDKIDGVTNTSQVQELIAELHRSGYGPYHGISSFPDLKNSKINSLYISAGGLGLPNRDYYTKTDEKSVEIREK